MTIHSKSYPMQTTLAVPGYVRPPTTLYEHFRADPRGATSFGQYFDEHRPVRIHEQAGGVAVATASMPLSVALDHIKTNSARWKHRLQVKDLNGAIITEWAHETKDSATVEKTR